MEDNRSDVYLLRQAISAAKVPADLDVVTDGEKALEFIQQIEADPRAPCPNLVILDLNLPKRTGHEVLEGFRGGGKCRQIQVLVVTSSDSEQDRQAVTRLGIAGYFRKPSTYGDFMKVGDIVRALLMLEPPDLPPV